MSDHIKDDVKCTNCEWAGLVELTRHDCPNCGSDTLAWRDPEHPERRVK